ncbi:MAG: GGDEF domain-containing protein [Gammaproteobacteria bacterium]|nr:GGDEF domain-containing protein [Gammaproteobacteria bacterium]
MSGTGFFIVIWRKTGEFIPNKLRTRVVLGLFGLHLVLGLFLYSVLLGMVKQAQDYQFSQHAQTRAGTIGLLVENIPSDRPQQLQSLMRRVLLQDDVVSVRLVEAGEDSFHFLKPGVNTTNTFEVNVLIQNRDRSVLHITFDRRVLLEDIRGITRLANILLLVYISVIAVFLFALSFLWERGEQKHLDLTANESDKADNTLVFDEVGEIRNAGRSVHTLLRYPSGTLIGLNIFDVLAEPVGMAPESTVLKLFGEQGATYDLSVCTRSGDTLTVAATVSSATSKGETLWSLFLGARLYQNVEPLQYDPLTGLLTRSIFLDRLAHSMQRAERNDCTAVLIFIDIDGFRRVNEGLGRRVGDKLLMLAAERIKQCVRQSDSVARLGDDEFAVILDDISDGCAAELPAKKILYALQQTYQIYSRDVHIGCSIGISYYPGRVQTSEEFMLEADLAMYKAKHGGGNRYEIFSDEMQRDMQELDQRIRCMKQ